MSYDLDFRFRRALNPEALTTIQSALTAVEDAIRDARGAGAGAGADPERDPAVTLLARHVGRVAQGQDVSDHQAIDQSLRDACMARVVALRAKPALVVLARRGVGYDPEARQAFNREAARHLRLLADAIGERDRSRIDISRHVGGAELTLETPSLWVRIATDEAVPGREVTYRRNDLRGERPRYADKAVLVDLDRFARSLARELGLALTPPALLV